MFIKQGNWNVVQRKLTDSTGRGMIMRAGLTENQAKTMVNQLRNHQATLNLTQYEKYDYWAIHCDDL